MPGWKLLMGEGLFVTHSFGIFSVVQGERTGAAPHDGQKNGVICNREQPRQDAAAKETLAMAGIRQPGPAFPKTNTHQQAPGLPDARPHVLEI